MLQNGVLRGSVVNCLTLTPGVLGWSRTGSSGFFVGVALGKTLQSPSLVLVKPRKDMNDVSCRHDMTEILLKWHKTPFNHSIKCFNLDKPTALCCVQDSLLNDKF